MKVLKLGKPKERKKWSIKRTCTGNGNDNRGCGSKLLIEETDIYMTYHSHYWGETDSYFTFSCPVCSAMTDINENSIPYEVQERIIARMEEQERLERENENIKSL